VKTAGQAFTWQQPVTHCWATRCMASAVYRNPRWWRRRRVLTPPRRRRRYQRIPTRTQPAVALATVWRRYIIGACPTAVSLAVLSSDAPLLPFLASGAGVRVTDGGYHLHAVSTTFQHPGTGERVSVAATEGAHCPPLLQVLMGRRA
jgi:hypothetical protein